MSVAKNIPDASWNASNVCPGNLIETTRQFFTSDVVGRLSRTLGEPVEKISAGLMAAIPTLFSGLLKMGSTESGVGEILDLVRQGGFDRRITSDFADPMRDSFSPTNGTNLVSRIFGDQTTGVVQAFASAVGMRSSAASGLLGAVAPVALSVIGQKAKGIGFNAMALKDMLMGQKGAILSALPSELSSAFTAMGLGLPFDLGNHGGTFGTKRSAPVDRSWLRPALIGGIFLLVGGLFLGTRERVLAPIPAESIGTSSSFPSPTSLPMATSSSDELALFLASPDRTALPKRLVFEELNFDFGTTRLTAESITTVDAMARTLRDHPNATIRLEGHTDNVGNPETNERLSLSRAAEVRNLLLERGIEPSRLQVMGRGQAMPIQSNETEQGRLHNRRIEVVILDF